MRHSVASGPQSQIFSTLAPTKALMKDPTGIRINAIIPEEKKRIQGPDQMATLACPHVTGQELFRLRPKMPSGQWFCIRAIFGKTTAIEKTRKCAASESKIG